jgi:non-ribosomal peptide synthetase-like protein
VSRTSIGPHSFLGNRIAYPAQGRTGDNCLLATKVMVPIDGPVREGVGLLGSPSFEIPRTVMRDNRFNHLETGDELRRRLAAKNKHNAATAGLYLLSRLTHLFVITLITMGAVDLYPSFGALAIALASVLTLTYTVVHFALAERASTGFRAQKPLYCSIYEPSFWRHERFWKMASVHYIQAFDGTPFKNVIWRLLGARIGKRVFDDGCFFPERTLVTVGDDSTLNAGTVVQCHSQEDGAFKSDRSVLGSGCTLGVGAFVHYGVTIADGAALAPDSFLMKGEEIPSRAQWGGNPAREMPDHKTQVEAGQGQHATQAVPALGR